MFAKWNETDGRFAFALTESAGAVEISAARYAELIGSGKSIVKGDDGTPIIVNSSRPTANQVWIGIKAERDRRKAGGVKVGDKWFHSDDASRIQQMALVMMGANIPANLQWKTMDGTFVAMNQTVANNVFAAAAASDQAIFAVAEGHRVAMEASADPDAYDYSTGWPAVFGE